MPHTLSYCALIGKCALIRSNTVYKNLRLKSVWNLRTLDLQKSWTYVYLELKKKLTYKNLKMFSARLYKAGPIRLQCNIHV